MRFGNVGINCVEIFYYKGEMMKKGQFIFADLSTYDVSKSQKFYKNILNWDYATEDHKYFLAYAGKNQAVGIYETPKKFQEMNMPHFWMTYIQVNNRDETVEKAKKMGAIIEAVEDLPFGKIALIRDPLGAGFTVYEGNQLNTRTENISGTLVWNELWVSNTEAVTEFYQTLFDWEYHIDEKLQRIDILLDGKKIGAIQQMPEEQRGKWQYWNSFFATENKKQALEKVKNNGGEILLDDENYTFCLDNGESAFFGLIEVKNTETTKNKNTDIKSKFPYKAFLVLSVVFVALAFSWYGIFGVLFLIFAYQDIKSGSTYLLDNVHKKTHPVLFWTIECTWVLLSIISILYNF